MLKESLLKLKQVLAKFESEDNVLELLEDTLEDGSVVKIDGTIDVGSKVMVISESGELPIPDGTYKLVTAGLTIVTLDGVISEVVAEAMNEVNPLSEIIARLDVLESTNKELVSKLALAETKIKEGFSLQSQTINLFEQFATAPVAEATTNKASMLSGKTERILTLSQNIQKLKQK